MDLKHPVVELWLGVPGASLQTRPQRSDLGNEVGCSKNESRRADVESEWLVALYIVMGTREDHGHRGELRLLTQPPAQREAIEWLHDHIA